MTRILVVDDKELMRDSVATTLTRKGHTVVAVANGKTAITKLSQSAFDAVVTDLQMPEMDGLELLTEIRQIDEQLPVVFMTAFGTIETAVAAMKQGAYDYITKPFSGDVLCIAVKRALDHGRLLKENQILRAQGTPAYQGGDSAPVQHILVGSGDAMTQLKQRMVSISDSHSTVLISGESGAGKEVAARWIHEHSPRARGPFLAINCAALSTSLLESELFGHEKGAFTGADRLRKGRFELADGGTLLLDEISEIDPGIQAKLLRVLQERTFERVGSSTSRMVDVRVIATTNRDLPAEVAGKRFRQDLYYRLNVLPLHMPALRDHVDDIPELVVHFLHDVAQREGKQEKRVDDDALRLMQEYHWPGNVRELQNICERAVVLANDEVVRASLIGSWLIELEQNACGISTNGAVNNVEVNGTHVAHDYSDIGLVCNGELTLDDIERQTIVATLEANNGHRQRSAKALGIGVRTLGLKLKKWKEQQIVSASL